MQTCKTTPEYSLIKGRIKLPICASLLADMKAKVKYSRTIEKRSSRMRSTT